MIKMYNIINLPYVLYGYETWPATRIESYISKVFENRALS
jgi:hypothetical protein